MNIKAKRIIRNLLIGLIITALMALAFYLYYGNIYTGYILLYGSLISLIFSKSFLLLFLKMKIEGTVIRARVSEYIEAAPARGLRGQRRIKIAVTVKTLQGHKFWKTFHFNSEEDDLPVGTRIRFTIFDDRPEVLKYPHNQKPRKENY
jgi:hypothetical protein